MKWGSLRARTDRRGYCAIRFYGQGENVGRAKTALPFLLFFLRRHVPGAKKAFIAAIKVIVYLHDADRPLGLLRLRRSLVRHNLSIGRQIPVVSLRFEMAW
jgi:hypothetical protein